MEYSRKQKQLDVKKWVDSETKGYDTCGSYDYCSNCDKDVKHPCAHAYEALSAISSLTKDTKTTTKKTTTTKKADTTTKSSTTAKKTTCKRTTTKKATATAC